MNSRELLILWFASGPVHEAKKRRVTQVIRARFHVASGLHMIKARVSPSCELCKGAQCTAQKKSVLGAHNKCWKYLLGAITKFGKVERKFEFIGERQRQTTRIAVEGHGNRKRTTMGGQ